MGYTATYPRPEKTHPTAKNRVWGFFWNSNKSRPPNRLQPAQPRRKIDPTTTKPASGVFFYGYRYYDPVTGRWLSRDPIQERGGLNLYGFVFNRPTGAIDTDGRAVTSIDGNLVPTIDPKPSVDEGVIDGQLDPTNLPPEPLVEPIPEDPTPQPPGSPPAEPNPFQGGLARYRCTRNGGAPSLVCSRGCPGKDRGCLLTGICMYDCTRINDQIVWGDPPEFIEMSFDFARCVDKCPPLEERQNECPRGPIEIQLEYVPWIPFGSEPNVSDGPFVRTPEIPFDQGPGERVGNPVGEPLL